MKRLRNTYGDREKYYREEYLQNNNYCLSTAMGGLRGYSWHRRISESSILPCFHGWLIRLPIQTASWPFTSPWLQMAYNRKSAATWATLQHVNERDSRTIIFLMVCRCRHAVRAN